MPSHVVPDSILAVNEAQIAKCTTGTASSTLLSSIKFCSGFPEMISEFGKSNIIVNLIGYPTAIEKFNLSKQSGKKIELVEP